MAGVNVVPPLLAASNSSKYRLLVDSVVHPAQAPANMATAINHEVVFFTGLRQGMRIAEA